jgi:hypothetical protein
MISGKYLVANRGEQHRARDGVFQLVSIVLAHAIYKATLESWVTEKGNHRYHKASISEPLNHAIKSCVVHRNRPRLSTPIYFFREVSSRPP